MGTILGILFVVLMVVLFTRLVTGKPSRKSKIVSIPKYEPSPEWQAIKDQNKVPSLELLLPSEITDSVFRKIEAEWEKQHPDPDTQWQRKMDERGAQIFQLEEENKNLKRLLLAEQKKNIPVPVIPGPNYGFEIDRQNLLKDYQKKKTYYLSGRYQEIEDNW